MLEEGDIVRCGFALGDGHGGNISFLDVGNARLVTVHASLNDRERLLVLNQGTTPILDISGDKASIEDSRPQIINALNTAVGHETRTRYESIGTGLLNCRLSGAFLPMIMCVQPTGAGSP